MNSTVGASGEIYIDDGVSIEPSSAFDVTLVAVGNNLTAQYRELSVAQPLGNVLGIDKQPKNVKFPGGNHI